RNKAKALRNSVKLQAKLAPACFATMLALGMIMPDNYSRKGNLFLFWNKSFAIIYTFFLRVVTRRNISVRHFSIALSRWKRFLQSRRVWILRIFR
ncbi:hypothetical protein, partial [Cronobacter malonaticus]|uniref:hypothetical protein n=1 Tax=Cronobacter malonaticus TaxID=413503 RepID=UPI001F46495B